MITMPAKNRILDRYRQARERIETKHIKVFPGQPGPVFLISTTYPGVWMEHAYDAIVYAKLMDGDRAAQEVAKNQLLLFLRNQKPDGRLPFNVMDMSILKERSGYVCNEVNYNQIQECVSVAALCVDVYEMTCDQAFLEEAYRRCAAWDAWLCANRMTTGQGLIELFCLFDTGHDNSARLADVTVQCPDPDGRVPVDSPAVPMLAPDMNAVFFGQRMALSKMARALKKWDESLQWDEKARVVKLHMLDLLYDAEDEFFFDRDALGHLRKFRTVAITNVFTEHVLDQAAFERIYRRHMKNPAEFWTPYPFPSMAMDDAGVKNHAPSNCWGYHSQALTALRCSRWMDHYGVGADYDQLLRAWVSSLARRDHALFGQEIDPITGEPTDCSEWYSSAMLLYWQGVKRLGYLD